MKLLSELDVTNKRVFVRADLDVPVGRLMVNSKSLIDDAEQATRLTNLKPTVDYLLDHDVLQIVIAGHIDRPEKPDPAFSTKNLLPHLEAILGQKIEFLEDLTGPVSLFPPASAKASAGRPASYGSAAVPLEAKRSGVGSLSKTATPQILLLENLRFWPGEVENDLDFAKKLANLAEVYVNEAFGNSHRNHASMVALPLLFSDVEDPERSRRAAGLHLQTEVETLNNLLKRPQRPFCAIVGGAKVETKVPVIENLARVADLVLVGGELPLEIQKSGQKFAGNVFIGTLTEDTNELSGQSTDEFLRVILTAKTIVWNGPVGYFEEGFEKATLAIADAIIKSGAYSVVGGGDTTQFLASHNLLARFSFVSAGGGAMLEFLAGRQLPGLKALE